MNMVITDSAGRLTSISIGENETFRELNKRMEKEHGIQMNFNNLQNDKRMHLDQNIVTYFSKKDVQAYLKESKMEHAAVSSVSNKEVGKTQKCSSKKEDNELEEEFHAVMNNIKVEEVEVEEMEHVDIKPIIIPEDYEASTSENSQLIHDSNRYWSIDSHCRLCATQNKNMVHIFGSNEVYKNILKMIENCLPIMVDETDALPKQVCRLCLEKLELCDKFHKTVEEAEKQFLILSEKVSDEFIKVEKYQQPSSPYEEELDFKNPGKDLKSDKKKFLSKQSFLPPTKNRKFLNSGKKISKKNDAVEETVKNESLYNKNGNCNTIKCRICGLVLRTISNCYTHAKIHASKNYYPCTLCNKSYANKLGAYKHNLEHAVDKRYKRRAQTKIKKEKESDSNHNSSSSIKNKKNVDIVEEINYPIANKGETIMEEPHADHSYASQNDKYEKVQCRICGLYFQTASSCYIHSRIHASHESFPCSMCDIIFTNERAICRHSADHISAEAPELGASKNRISYSAEQKRLQKGRMPCHKIKHNSRLEQTQCKLCDKSMSSELSLAQHTFRIHGQRMEFICETCGKIFRSKVGRDAHQGKLIFRPFVCPLCSCRFYAKNHLDLHRQRNCRLTNNWACSYCGKSFSRKWSLNNHIRIHTGERPFGCDYCSKMFLTKQTRDQHRVSHAEVGRLKCLCCDKTYCDSTRLKKHEVLHTGERFYDNNSSPKEDTSKKSKTRKFETSRKYVNDKRWQCDICDAYFLGPSTLRIHNKTQHGPQ